MERREIYDSIGLQYLIRNYLILFVCYKIEFKYMDFVEIGFKKDYGQLLVGKVLSVFVKYVIYMKCYSYRKDIKKVFHIWQGILWFEFSWFVQVFFWCRGIIG